MKKRLSLLLTLVMVFSLVPVNKSHAATLNIMDNPKMVTPDSKIEASDELYLTIGKDSAGRYEGLKKDDEFTLTLEGEPVWDLEDGRIYYTGKDGRENGLPAGDTKNFSGNRKNGTDGVDEVKTKSTWTQDKDWKTGRKSLEITDGKTTTRVSIGDSTSLDNGVKELNEDPIFKNIWEARKDGEKLTIECREPGKKVIKVTGLKGTLKEGKFRPGEEARPAVCTTDGAYPGEVTGTITVKFEDSGEAVVEVEEDDTIETIVEKLNGSEVGNGRFRNLGKAEATRNKELKVTTTKTGTNAAVEIKSNLKAKGAFKNKTVVAYKKVSDKTVVARVISYTDSERSVKIPMEVNMNGAGAGDHKVILTTNGRNITNGSYVYAKVAESKIVLGVEKVEKISRIGANKVTLTLTEVDSSAFAKENGEITLRLPVGYSWKNVKAACGSKEVVTDIADGDRDLNLVNLAGVQDSKKTDKVFINAEISVSKDARLGDVDVTVKRGSNVSPYSLVIAQNVNDSVNVTVGKVLDVIAGKDIDGKYVAEVYLEENIENALLHGRYVEFTLKDGSLQDGQTLKLEKLKGTAAVEIDTGSSDAFGEDSVKNAGKVYTSNAAQDHGKVKADNWELFVNSSSKSGSRSKYKLVIPFVVKSDFTGDLILNVKGAGVVGDAKNGGVDLKIATVKAPVTVKADQPLAQVKIGLQDQMGSKITVTETEAAALQDFVPGKVAYGKAGSKTRKYFVYVGKNNNGNYKKVADNKFEYEKDASKADYRELEEEVKETKGRAKLGSKSSSAKYTISSTKKGFGIEFTGADVKVTDGDLSLDGDSGKDKKEIKVVVDRVSTKPSTIEITGVKMTLDRTVPYGDVKLDANFGIVGERHDLTNKTVTFDYIKTLTPAPDAERVGTIFKIGETGYTKVVGDSVEQVTADVAPYIANDRTMLPIRQVADVLGIKVSWNPKTKTAIFDNNAGLVATITAGKLEVVKNGTHVPLDAVEITSDRMFVPVAQIGEVFGLQRGSDFDWVEASRSVVFYPQKATQSEMDKIKEKAGVVAKEEAPKMEEKKADEKKAEEAPKMEEKKTEEKK